MKRFNILMITQEDPFYVRLFFEEFFRNYGSIDEIKGVVIAPTMGKKSFKKLLKQMYGFYGAFDFFKMGFRYACYKLCDRASRTIPLKGFYSIEQLCRRYGVPVMHRSNVNSDAFLKDIKKLDLDLIISVAAPQIFKEKLIAVPKESCINIHNSKLPKYRGMLPNFWQMYHGEKAVGTTVHRINAGVDDGDILIQKETEIQSGESLDSLICRTKRFGAAVMMEAIDGIKAGSLKPMPNSKEEATYFTFPTRQDVAEFRRRGNRLL
ncbi:MAG: methionyl-tRNA formyltransferase [Thermodesulfobacteriota bacterium]